MQKERVMADSTRNPTTEGVARGEANRVVVRGCKLLGVVEELLQDPTVRKLVLGNQRERILEIPVPHSLANIGDLPGYTTLCAIAVLQDEFVIDITRKDPSAPGQDG
jgi:hypothetical protein